MKKNCHSFAEYRRHCAFCHKKDNDEALFAVKDFPVFMGCTDEPLADDLSADMSFAICKNCGGVQLNPFMLPSMVYKKPHGSGTIGKSWGTHHKEFARFISNYQPKEVFEIGASHDSLAKNYLKINANIVWTILDPNPPKQKNTKLKYQKGFFGFSYENTKKYDCLVHSHTYEHFIDVQSITHKFFNLLNEDGIMIFSIPNLQSHYDYLYTNVMNYEHTVFLSEMMVDMVLKNNGFVIEDKKYHQNNHSIFYACRKKTSLKRNLSYNFYNINKQCLLSWYGYHIDLIKNLNNEIDKVDGDLFLFGAHAVSQLLISFGLDTNKIRYVLDNDINKHGSRLYGTNLICKSPQEALLCKSPTIILRSGVFSGDISEGIINTINKDTKFINGHI